MKDSSRIVLRRRGQRWRQPEVGAYDNEQAMQQLLVESPDLIPGLGPAVAIDELYLPETGSVDIVAVEPTGAITLVECKLAANSEIRRAVIGQIFAYAAGAWKMTYEAFDERFRQRSGRSLIDAIESLGAEVGTEWSPEDFRLSVIQNLEAGAFRLFVAVDRITEELKSIVEYINTHTSPDVEVLALELGYVADEDVEILLPRTHGEESARVKVGTKTKPNWSVEDVFNKLSSLCTQGEVEAVRRLYDDLIQRGGKVYPGRGSYPTMSGYLQFDGDHRSVWAVYADPSGPTAPRVSLNFGSWTKNLGEQELTAILRKLRAVEGLAAYLEAVEPPNFNVYPSVPIRH